MSAGNESGGAAADEFDAAVGRLGARISHWTLARWLVPDADGVSSLELLHGLAQRIADLDAAAEGLPRRPVPRLGGGDVLRDQIRVVANDLIAAAPSREIMDAANRAVADVSRAVDRCAAPIAAANPAADRRPA